ncbi:MAG TPA: ADOP family duplicated permease [Vicinamibacteria bacterium]|nr:ADOP family duplicated permease [Vicinamibacteria bacterium]
MHAATAASYDAEVRVAILSDWRHGVRVFRRHPGVLAVAVGSLTLGIGVAAAVFAIADARFMRPLAVEDPSRLVSVFTVNESGQVDTLSYPEVQDVASLSSVAGVAAYDLRGATLRRGDDLQMLELAAVSDDYFKVLGVNPALGRVISAGVDRGLPAPAVLISDRLFRTGFGGDASLVGRPVELSDRPYTLVGVLPREFRGLDRQAVTDVWISLDTWSQFYNSRADLSRRAARNFELLARLRPGATLRQASAEIAVLGARWAAGVPEARGRSLRVSRAERVAGETPPVVILLLAGAALVLLIACANVSTLLLGLNEARRVELSLRQALGASRAGIARQILAETVLLATAGVAGGLALASLLLRAAPALLPPSPVAVDYGIEMDARVVACAGLLGALAALLGGLVPALRAGRLTPAPTRVTEETASPRRLLTVPAALVVVQMVLAVVAVNTAALLLASFDGVRRASRGFDTARSVLALQLSMGDERSGDLSRWTTELEAARLRMLGVPGVRNATYVRRLPMAGYGGGATIRVGLPGGETLPLRYNQAGPAFAETLGIRLRQGRFFEAAEHAGGQPVAVVSEAFVRQYFRGETAVGRQVMVGGALHLVVGVVEDAPVNWLHERAEPFLYFPYSRKPTGDTAFLVETAGDPTLAATATKAAVRESCPGVHVLDTRTLRGHMSEQLHDDWFQAVLGSGLAVLGVALALAGLYATVSRMAARRTREVGVRMALGAGSGDVLRLVLRQGLTLASVGALAGLLSAALAAVLLRSLLRGVGPLDPRAFAATAFVAVALGVLASLQPAWRAACTDPARVLRAE